MPTRRCGLWLLLLGAALSSCADEAPRPSTRAAIPQWRAALGPIGAAGAAGRVEHLGVVTDTPLEDVAAEDFCSWRPAWRLSGMDSAALETLLRGAGLAPPIVRRLLAAAACDPAGCDVSPPADLLASLPARQRAALYAAALSNPIDARHVVVLRRPRDDRALWIDARLSPAAQSAIDELTIELGDDALVPDPAALCARLPLVDDRVRAMRTLLRTHAERLRLTVTSPGDLESLARYWGAGGRENEVRALITGLSAVDHGGPFDVLYLLPPYARWRLMTFPGYERPLVDCHWTTLNFWSAAPPGSPPVFDVMKARFDAEYEEIAPAQLGFGDVVMLTARTPLGELPVHSATYIADGVVFTKNGFSPSIPWVLARLDDVVAGYHYVANGVRFLRKKTGRR